jgi:SAM-dependent methyltransferase
MLKNIFLYLLILFLIIIKSKKKIEYFTDKYVFTTYGTITDKGLEKLVNKLKINKNDIFLDAGCGEGNVLIYFAKNTSINKLTGIEYVKERFEKSEKNIKNEKLNSKIKVINGNMYDKENSNIFLNSTIIFTCSTCFSEELMNYIKNKCENNNKLKYFITQKKLLNNSKLNYLGDIETDCSWSKNCLHHIYSNTLKNI